MKFEMLKENSSLIKVIGVGGGGGNAVNHMFLQGIKGVDFIICNTDAQALDLSPIPNKVQLGSSLTEGRGAGSIPEVGKNSAIENIEDIKEMLSPNTKMLFITAGMGGGTGTGASPIIAQAAKELGILTVAIVTTPFSFEGKRRRQQADEGLEELKRNVDTLLVISNEKLREMFGNLTLSSAFGQADDILTTAAKGIAEIITMPGYINVDFEDVKTVMKSSGVAIMGSATAEGEGRAKLAVESALASPLLNDNEIEGARYILLNITSGTNEVLMDEVSEITNYIQEEAGLTADIIWGNCFDANLGEKISVTLIATGFQTRSERTSQPLVIERKVMSLEEPIISPESKIEFEREVSSEPVMKSDIRQVSIFDELNVSPISDNEKKEIVTKKVIAAAEKKQVVQVQEPEPVVNTEEQEQTMLEQQRHKDRILRLKDLSMKLRATNGIADLEKEPAYIRKNAALENVPHSSESAVSRFTLTTEQGVSEIKPNNSFLHDNVD